ncbi:cob(I)yrinic acid a,c-diamide adenosyltransferase [Nigerium massiliense]|uniref:cob(I)yrinic acid a,c-diamide adenosyltransferase n=1 Tax=Nigerium massiliense TaxID=1522317 RepID=UPI00058CCFA7|nr:cob(I)yrinic acid a,c-diamide adenosyltransferase [Nigerium massiliense]
MSHGVPPAGRAGQSGRELRLAPRLIVHTGDGKGKSTAAFGMALRGWAQGWSIGVFQFVKSAKWRTGERAAFAALDEHHRRTGEGGPVEWQSLGAGWTWLRSTAGVDQAALARAGWERVAGQLAAEAHQLYVLDEFTYVLANGWVGTEEVLAALASRPGTQHVVITGRRAPAELIEAADLVSDVHKLKHPFDGGAKGQPGIEW